MISPNPAVAVQLVNGVIARGGQVVLGPLFTGSCASVAPIVEKNGPVSFCFTPGFTPARGSFVFSPAVSTSDYVLAFLRYFRAKHWNRVGILTTTDATGQAGMRAFDFWMPQPEQRAMSVVGVESMGVSDISASAQVQRLKAARPDVIFFTGSGPPFGTFLRALIDAGLDIPIGSSTANMTYASMQQYKDVLPKELLFAGLRGMSMVATPKGPIRDKQTLYFRSFKAAGIRPTASISRRGIRPGLRLTPYGIWA